MGEVNWVWGGLNFSFTGRSRSGLGLSYLCTAVFCQFLWIHLVCFCTAVHRERKHHSTLIALPLTPAMRKKIPTFPWNQIRFCLNEIKVVDLYPLGIYIYIYLQRNYFLFIPRTTTFCLRNYCVTKPYLPSHWVNVNRNQSHSWCTSKIKNHIRITSHQFVYIILNRACLYQKHCIVSEDFTVSDNIIVYKTSA